MTMIVNLFAAFGFLVFVVIVAVSLVLWHLAHTGKLLPLIDFFKRK